MKLDEKIISQVKALKKPAIIAISGFGGSGKTTLANLLSEALNAPIISIDSFNKGIAEYSNWELMDFERFEKEIIIPFYSGQNPLKYTHFSGEPMESPKEVQVNHSGVIIVEGVGILRPELMKHYSYSIWIECPIEEAVRRGKKRDREVWHNPKDELWEGIWKRNDLEYYELFKPNKAANVIIDNFPRRFSENPIIKPEMLPNDDGENINGPSLIKVPDWVENPLGKYYLYFAHHNGHYIRMAYANSLAGPWSIYEPGTLHLAQASGCVGHIASPDVVIDEETKQLRMYFHGPAKVFKGQKSFVATSKDGLNFQAFDEILGMFYFRVFKWQDYWYAMAKGGQLYRSKDGLTHFEQGQNPFPGSSDRDQDYDDSGLRHVALHLTNNKLWVYYSNIGDSPERILRCSINLTDDWNDWKTSKPEEVLKPETDYEGVNLPQIPSQSGSAKELENALRDPAIFEEGGKTYLLYSVAGESGIAIAEL